MTKKRYTIILGKNNEFKFIIDYSKQDKPISMIEFLNQVNEQDKAFKQLKEKNKELKYKLRNCKDARQSYKQDWKACSSYCDEYKSKIISLKDEVEGLIEENNELKKENDILIKQRLGEERLKQEIADYHTSNSKLHQLNKCLIRLLDEFHIDYSDILREFYD